MIPRARHLALFALTLIALLVFAGVREIVSLTVVEITGGVIGYVLAVSLVLCLFRVGAIEDRKAERALRPVRDPEWPWPPRDTERAA